MGPAAKIQGSLHPNEQRTLAGDPALRFANDKAVGFGRDDEVLFYVLVRAS
jgi:hypothetical protein